MGKEQVISEIKAAITEAGLKLDDLFTVDEIKTHKVFDEVKVSAHEHAKRIEKMLGVEREKIIDLTKSIDEKDTKLKQLNEIVSVTKTNDLFGKAREVRKLDEKETKFIEKRLKTFKSDKDGDELKTDFDKFIDAQIGEYLETAKLLGVEIKKDEQGKEGVGSGDGKGKEPLDLTDPQYNELIPK